MNTLKASQIIIGSYNGCYRGYAADVTPLPVAILSGRSQVMGKSCCAIGCTNRYSKGGGLSFYRFPEEPVKRAQWIAAVSRKNWQPNEHTWICSAHFVGGAKSNDSLSPAYIPSVFSHVEYPVKRKTEYDMIRYEKNKANR